jgi:hypothetical protein
MMRDVLYVAIAVWCVAGVLSALFAQWRTGLHKLTVNGLVFDILIGCLFGLFLCVEVVSNEWEGVHDRQRNQKG